LPSRDSLAARLADGLCTTFIDYEAGGFEHFVARWPDRDWLFGRVGLPAWVPVLPGMVRCWSTREPIGSAASHRVLLSWRVVGRRRHESAADGCR
jgi:hypothetical protein